MAGSIYQWSATAADNGTADADVPWPEGMARRQVNDSARSLMGRVAELLGDLGGALSAGGTANGLTVTANSGFTTYADGRVVSFRATADNTGAATLNVNGIGAKAIRKMDSTGDVALVAGEIQNTGIYVAQYQEALNGAAGAWLLVNPTLSSAIYALSGLTTVDNTVPRFSGTGGQLQTSSVVIDDSNNVSGIGTLASGAITSTGSVTSSQVFTSAASTILSGSGAVTIRPNGTGSSAGQFQVGTSGAVTADGSITSSQSFISAAAGAILASTGAGSVTLRPNGVASSTGQASLASTGALTVNGALAATTGAFSSTVSMTALTATTGTFSGAVSGTTGTFSGAVSGTTVSASTAFRAAAGSAGAPSISFTGDTNTGFYTDSADEISISTAGTRRGKFTDTAFNWGREDADPSVQGASLSSDGQCIFAATAEAALIANRIGSDGVVVDIRNDNTQVGSISVSGAATAYNESSDGRRKKNRRDFDSGGFLDALEVWHFDWISGGEGYGVIAQDANQVFPHAITYDEQNDLWMADYSKFVPLLIAEVKALRARVALLEPLTD